LYLTNFTFAYSNAGIKKFPGEKPHTPFKRPAALEVTGRARWREGLWEMKGGRGEGRERGRCFLHPIPDP